MGYGLCSTGAHIAWISEGEFRSFKCDCPPMPVMIYTAPGPKPNKAARRAKRKA